MSSPLAESKFDSRDLNRDGKVTASERLQAAAGRMMGDERSFYNPKMDEANKQMQKEWDKSMDHLKKEFQPYVTQAKKAADYFRKKVGGTKE